MYILISSTRLALENDDIFDSWLDSETVYRASTQCDTNINRVEHTKRHIHVHTHYIISPLMMADRLQVHIYMYIVLTIECNYCICICSTCGLYKLVHLYGNW